MELVNATDLFLRGKDFKGMYQNFAYMYYFLFSLSVLTEDNIMVKNL